MVLTSSYRFCSGNAKEEPGAIVCRVSQSFLRFGSYQIHASRGEEDLEIVGKLADYAIRDHFPCIEKSMNRSDGLSFKTGDDDDDSVVDLTSNKYAGNFPNEVFIKLLHETPFKSLMILCLSVQIWFS